MSAVDRVGQSGWLILGQEVQDFELELAKWWGVPYAVGVASGLDALEIALRCAGVGMGDSVVTTPLTAFATTLAILRVGARPIWCDVDESGGLDLEQVDAVLKIDRSIRAVVPVHLYGHPLDPSHLGRLTADRDIVVIEDCAQSAGAMRDGRPTGLSGVAAGTSLYPTKNLGAMGDGGILLTSDAGLAEQAKRMRDYGQGDRYQHIEVGLNSRLDELHAAILRSALLPRLDTWLKRRSEIATRYTRALHGSNMRPIIPAAGLSAHHLFPVEVLDRAPEDVARCLAQSGIMVGRHYPFVCPDQPAVAHVGTSIGSLPVARRLATRELSLPIHPHLNDGEVESIIQACMDACA